MEILEVLALWFCISVPMVFLGAYFGYRKPVEPYPVVTSNIPRQVCPPCVLDAIVCPADKFRRDRPELCVGGVRIETAQHFA